MLRHHDYTRSRIHQLRTRFQNRIYRKTAPIAEVLVSPRVERISYEEATKLPYRPAVLGEQFGPLFATYWFKVKVVVPADWRGERVDLLWSTRSENTVWIDGRAIQGLNQSSNQDRLHAKLLDKAKGGETIELYLEMACNNAFGMEGVQWPEHRSPIWLDRTDIGLFDELAKDIYHDLNVLCELEKESVSPGKAGTAETVGGAGDLDPVWAGKLLFELNRFANQCEEEDRSTWAPARKILTNLLATRNGGCVHHLSAIGHAHIDTAWLWPLAETHRKCVRSFGNATRYMEDYPEYKFACSQAYQYWIVKKINPDLYERMKKAAKKGQWVPVGGTWIEPDCNIPSGESLIRQFVFGQRFFEQEFGARCKEFWNPDVFGYNGQLPQIMRECGVTRFLTQKLSWNWFNKPMHHTFHWEGIDGSPVLAHFPPADTYNAECHVPQVRFHVKNYKDNDRSREAIYLFGYGDGGGGPTVEMLEQLRRMKDLQGLPQVAQRTSDEFFDRLEKDIADIPRVVGELYFELHRGTYTTQAKTKRGNRKNEILLHDVEFLSAVANRLTGKAYPAQEAWDLWQIILLNQFHDILPGSSITAVYEETEANHADVAAKGAKLREEALNTLGAPGSGAAATPVNTLSFARTEVVELPGAPGGKLGVVEAPSYGFGRIVDSPTAAAVKVTESGDTVTLENAALRAILHQDGRLLSLVHLPTGRESLAEPGNVLEMSTDKPTKWEAWDVDPWIIETEEPCPGATSCKVTQKDPLRAEVTFERTLGEKSRMIQTVRLDATGVRLEVHCNVDWAERQKMLKVAFPLAARSLTATYEMQFGAVERPTHSNNSFALAQYEVPAHKWADLSEHGFGVSLLSESKYGFSCRGSTMRMSLLRSTTMPDPQADLGRQEFVYAIYPHAGTWRDGGVVAEAARFNVPVVWAPGAQAVKSFFTVGDPNLVLDTVKKAEDSDALVLRFYECHGARGEAPVTLNVSAKSAVRCNALEDEGEPIEIRDGVMRLAYTPYKVITVKVK